MLIIDDNYDKFDFEKVVLIWNMKVSTDEIENDWDYEPHPMTKWMMVTLVNEASNKYDHEAFFYDFTMTLATKVVIEDITI